MLCARPFLVDLPWFVVMFVTIRHMRKRRECFCLMAQSIQDMHDKISNMSAIDDKTYAAYCCRSRELAEDLLSKND